jgi:cell division initiation protein
MDVHTTPLDLRQQTFRKKFRGYDTEEVRNLLEQTAETLETLRTENENLLQKNERLQHETEGYRKREETFKRAMLNSQKVMEQMKENARKSADLIVAEAEVRAEKLLNGAHNRLSQLHEDIAELKRQRMQIEIQIRSILESHSKLLEIRNENTKEDDEIDSKIKLFQKHNHFS